MCRLDPVCDYVEANLALRFTLSDMARISGLSTRSLQYAFLYHYQCSPMHWVMKLRLSKIRQRLLHGQPGDTVAAIARAHGFASASAFSAHYLREFDELPSTTRLRA